MTRSLNVFVFFLDENFLNTIIMHILQGLKVLVYVLEGGKCRIHNLNISERKIPFHLI